MLAAPVVDNNPKVTRDARLGGAINVPGLGAAIGHSELFPTIAGWSRSKSSTSHHDPILLRSHPNAVVSAVEKRSATIEIGIPSPPPRSIVSRRRALHHHDEVIAQSPVCPLFLQFAGVCIRLQVAAQSASVGLAESDFWYD